MDAVFIHTNNQQILGALVGAHSMKRRSRDPDAFDVRLLRLELTPHLYKREGQAYLRKGRTATWRNRDLQSFSPLRKQVPQLMGYEGRGVVVDPDVFAVGDVLDLIRRPLDGRAILCRVIREGYKGNGAGFYASSVMLLDCARLSHWRWDAEVDEMFAMKRDYGPWIGLTDEDPELIGELEPAWNSFDELGPDTKLLHNTERETQPWKTGLPVDFDTTAATPAPGLLGRIKRKLGLRAPSAAAAPDRYAGHPDPKQEAFFFTELGGALRSGEVSEGLIEDAMGLDFIRHDAFETLSRHGYRKGEGPRRDGRLEERFEIGPLGATPWAQ